MLRRCVGNGLDRLRLRRLGCVGERALRPAQDGLESTAAGRIPGARVRADRLIAELGRLNALAATLECSDVVEDRPVERGQQLRG